MDSIVGESASVRRNRAQSVGWQWLSGRRQACTDGRHERMTVYVDPLEPANTEIRSIRKTYGGCSEEARPG